MNKRRRTRGGLRIVMLKRKSNNLKASARTNIVERLFSDPKWMASYRVSEQEREFVSNTAMMGELTCERDVLFVLNQIRRARLRW